MIKKVFSLIHANKHQQAGRRDTNSCPYCSSCLCLSGHDGVALGRWPCLCFPVVWRLVQKVRGGKTPVAFGRVCGWEREESYHICLQICASFSGIFLYTYRCQVCVLCIACVCLWLQFEVNRCVCIQLLSLSAQTLFSPEPPDLHLSLPLIHFFSPFHSLPPCFCFF